MDSTNRCLDTTIGRAGSYNYGDFSHVCGNLSIVMTQVLLVIMTNEVARLMKITINDALQEKPIALMLYSFFCQ